MTSTPPRPSRSAYLLAAPFETAIAVAAVLSGIYSLLHPDPLQQAAIGHAGPWLLPLWEVLYTISGATILAGLFAQSVRVEIAGLSLLAAAVLINAFAIVNFSGAKGVISFATFLALMGACVGRSYMLLRGRQRLAKDSE